MLALPLTESASQALISIKDEPRATGADNLSQRSVAL